MTLDPHPGRQPRANLHRKLTGPGAVPTAMRKVKGVGRHARRDYCETCGHTNARCICPTPMRKAAA